MIGAEQFADPTHGALAELVLPRLRAGQTPAMHDWLDELRDTPMAQTISHMWFVGQLLIDQADADYAPFTDATEAMQASIEKMQSDAKRTGWNDTPTQDAAEVAARIEHLRQRGGKPSAIHREDRH